MLIHCPEDLSIALRATLWVVDLFAWRRWWARRYDPISEPSACPLFLWLEKFKEFMIPVCLHGDYTHQLGVLLGSTSDILSEIFQWNYGSLKPGCHTQRIIWWTLAGSSNCEMLNTTMPGGLSTLHTSLYSYYVFFTLFLCTKVRRGAWKGMVIMCIDTYFIYIILKVMQRSRKQYIMKCHQHVLVQNFIQPPTTSNFCGRGANIFQQRHLGQTGLKSSVHKRMHLISKGSKSIWTIFFDLGVIFLQCYSSTSLSTAASTQSQYKKDWLVSKRRLKEQ